MNTQDARSQYREHIGGFFRSGTNYGKPYLKPGWVWSKVRFPAGGPYTSGYVSLSVHPTAEPAMRALASTFLHYGYLFKESAGGTVSMRNITGASKTKIAAQVVAQYPYATSLHAHGVAVDINPSKNPYGSSRPDELDEPKWQGMITSVKRIQTVDGHLVFRWGGDWSNDDDMHFECIQCTRPQLERGIKLTSVEGWAAYQAWAGNPTLPPTNPPNQGDEILKRGDKGKAVAEYQHAGKKFWGWNNGTFTPFAGKSSYDGQNFGPGEDGSFGATMETNVKAFQKSQGLPENGVIGDVTGAMLLAGYGSAGTTDAYTRAQSDAKYAKVQHPHTIS